MATDGRTLADLVHGHAESLPGADLSHPFGPEHDVYKVRGKVFALLVVREGVQFVTLKAHPDEAAALREEHPEILPGYHMNKKHWITLTPGDTLDAAEIREIVTDSYVLVVAGLPHRLRPVDPATFAGGGAEGPPGRADRPAGPRTMSP